MTTAARVLDIARSQLGIRQAANGANKYGAAYGMDRVAWCNQFTWWCLREAGAAHLTPKSAYTPTTFNWYKQRGLTGSQPRVGALVFFNWGPPLNRISHIGFVEAVNRDGSITTIEGNTSTGNDRMGGGVMRRVRRGAIVGYAYPQYASAGAPTPPPPAPASGDKPNLRPWVFDRGHYLGHMNGPAASIGGYYGPIGHIEDMQRKLIWLGLVPGVPASSWRTSRWADGKWEDATTPVVQAWFRKYRPNQPIHTQIWSDDYAFMAGQ